MTKQRTRIKMTRFLTVSLLAFTFLSSAAKAEAQRNFRPRQAVRLAARYLAGDDAVAQKAISNWRTLQNSNGAAASGSTLPMQLPLPAEGTEYNQAVTVTLVGDSITKGMSNDDSIPGGFSAECWQDACFAALLDVQLETAHEEGLTQKANVINIGVGGATARDYDPNDYSTDDYHFFANPLIQSEAGRPLFQNIPASQIAVVYLGTNDAVGFFETEGVVSPEQYKSYLIDIVTSLYRNGVQDVVLITPPIPSVWANTPEGQRMREYRNAIVDLCGLFPQNADTCYLDLQSSYPAEEWIFGAVHPTLVGHTFIAQALFEHLQPLLQR